MNKLPRFAILIVYALVLMLIFAAVSRMAKTFGVRTFRQDLDSQPKGRFLLNGKEIRLRGANTMGFEQQDVMRGDFDQLIDDCDRIAVEVIIRSRV